MGLKGNLSMSIIFGKLFRKSSYSDSFDCKLNLSIKSCFVYIISLIFVKDGNRLYLG